MTTPKIERLTPAQAERLTSFRREWFEIGTNTDRADRAKAEAAIMAMRAEIGVKTKPTFVWCASPATSLLALHAIKSPQWQKLVGDRLGDPLRGSLRDSLRGSLGDLATSIGSAWFGQHEAYWIAFYLFLSRYPWCQI